MRRTRLKSFKSLLDQLIRLLNHVILSGRVYAVGSRLDSSDSGLTWRRPWHAWHVKHGVMAPLSFIRMFLPRAHEILQNTLHICP